MASDLFGWTFWVIKNNTRMAAEDQGQVSLFPVISKQHSSSRRVSVSLMKSEISSWEMSFGVVPNTFHGGTSYWAKSAGISWRRGFKKICSTSRTWAWHQTQYCVWNIKLSSLMSSKFPWSTSGLDVEQNQMSWPNDFPKKKKSFPPLKTIFSCTFA